MKPKVKFRSNKSKLSYAVFEDRKLRRLFMELIESVTGRKKLEKIYKELDGVQLDQEDIWPTILSKLKINTLFDPEKLEQVPKEGPVVFIANHPFGVVDGLIMGYLLAQVRPKFYVLANSVLCQDELIGEYLLPVDFKETKEALATNINTRKVALQRLAEGEAVAIFPAGGVSTSPKIVGKAEDFEWKRFVLKLIRKTNATVVPVYFHGQNSRLFQIASHINMNLRLALLLNEVRNKIGKEIKVSIGDPIPYERIAIIKDQQEVLDYLRMVTYSLSK